MSKRMLHIAAASLAVIAAVGMAGRAHALDPAPQPVVVTPLASTMETAAGQPILPPQKDVRVIASRFEIAPGAALPVHKHPFPRYAYVLSGTLKVTDAQTGAATIYKAGDFIVEMVDRWHFGANVGDDAIELLVIDQVEGDAKHTILRQP